MSDSVRPQRWQPIMLPRPWSSPGNNTGMGRHALLQGIFLTQRLSPQFHAVSCGSCITGRFCITGPSGGGDNGTPLQYSCLENPMDGGAWKAAVHWVTEGQTRLSDLTFTFHFPALEKEMATHSSVLTWRIPGTGEPGGLPSLGSHRVGHN